MGTPQDWDDDELPLCLEDAGRQVERLAAEYARIRELVDRYAEPQKPAPRSGVSQRKPVSLPAKEAVRTVATRSGFQFSMPVSSEEANVPPPAELA